MVFETDSDSKVEEIIIFHCQSTISENFRMSFPYM